MAQHIVPGIIGAEFENTIRLNTEVIVGGRGSQARGYGKSFNLAPRSNNKADGEGRTAISRLVVLLQAPSAARLTPVTYVPTRTTRWRDNFCFKVWGYRAELLRVLTIQNKCMLVGMRLYDSAFIMQDHKIENPRIHKNSRLII